MNVDLIYAVAAPEGVSPLVGEVRRGGEYALSQAQDVALRPWLAQHGRFLGRSGGGQAANTAYACACWGIPTALVGRVGADEDGEFLLEGLKEVDGSLLVRQGVSGRAYILLDGTGERTILVAPNTNDQCEPGDVPPEMLAAARFMHLTSFVGEGPLAAQAAWLTGRPVGAEVSLDPGELYARRGRVALGPLLARLDTLLVTEAEWELLGGEGEVRPHWAPPRVIVKRGAQGARLLTASGVLEVAGEAVAQVTDTLGAGDVLAAGWLAGQVHGLDDGRALQLANRLAAASLKGRGREGYPDREAFDRILQSLR